MRGLWFLLSTTFHNLFLKTTIRIYGGLNYAMKNRCYTDM